MINLVRNQLKKVINREIEIEVFPSEKEAFGHYSTNVAFKLAPILSLPDQKVAPFEVAKKISDNLKAMGGKEFSKIEAIQPGFINFWISPGILHSRIKEVLAGRKKRAGGKGQKINVEFVSANPTGPLTMANGRGGFYGDVLANVLEKAGNKVTREYYVNDAGNQIKILGQSIMASSNFIDSEENFYQGGYIKDLAKKLKIKNKEANFEEVGKKAAAILIKEITKSLKGASIKHDVWFSEDKKLRGKKGLINKILMRLIDEGLVIDKDGAKWLKTSDIEDEKDRVLVKSDGQPTYFLADMAYHYDKFINRKFNLAIDIWGADHHGYVARLKSGVKALGVNPNRLKIVITQMVRLMSGGKEIKMSKRTGEFVTMDELIKEVGADAARFFFLMHSADTHMDFDLDLAKERSQKNPVYYAQYAYVRALNILRKAKKPQNYNLRLLASPAEMRLMLELVKLPDLIKLSAEDYQVNRLTKYVLELARSFHNFYEKEKVVGIEDKEMGKARLALVSAVKMTMESLFNILGVGKPSKM
ncbi:MAG: arginine--tRNA ligase [Candidatus Pacebacteria bacterium]|nr:arginine--tRNA ligase [Candidatus Paceibacterota bacterium]